MHLGFIYGTTTPQTQNHPDGRHSHPDPTPRATARGLRTGTTTNGENGNTALDDSGTTRQRGDETTRRRDTRGRRHTERKKAQETSATSPGLLVSFFFLFSFHLTFTNNILGTDPTYGEKGHDEETTKRTRHPAPPTTAASNCSRRGNREQTTRTPK